MGRIRRSLEAGADLFSIHQYLSDEAGPEIAEQVLTAFEEKLLTLSDNPGLGTRRVPGLPEVRAFPIGSYLLFYVPLPEGDGIRLIRVLHGARNWAAIFDD